MTDLTSYTFKDSLREFLISLWEIKESVRITSLRDVRCFIKDLLTHAVYHLLVSK